MKRLDEPRQVLKFLTGPARPDDDQPGLDLLFADASGTALEVIMPIDQVPADPPQDERVRVLGPLLRAFAKHEVTAGMALVVRRGGDPEPGGGDYAWHDAFSGACKVAGLTSHGVYVATRRGARQVLPVGQ